MPSPEEPTGDGLYVVDVDLSRCVGHGKCYGVAPELMRPFDDEGHAHPEMLLQGEWDIYKQIRKNVRSAGSDEAMMAIIFHLLPQTAQDMIAAQLMSEALEDFAGCDLTEVGAQSVLELPHGNCLHGPEM